MVNKSLPTPMDSRVRFGSKPDGIDLARGVRSMHASGLRRRWWSRFRADDPFGKHLIFKHPDTAVRPMGIQRLGRRVADTFVKHSRKGDRAAKDYSAVPWTMLRASRYRNGTQYSSPRLSKKPTSTSE
jgi:hypothetical protein